MDDQENDGSQLQITSHKEETLPSVTSPTALPELIPDPPNTIHDRDCILSDFTVRSGPVARYTVKIDLADDSNVDEDSDSGSYEYSMHQDMSYDLTNDVTSDTEGFMEKYDDGDAERHDARRMSTHSPQREGSFCLRATVPDRRVVCTTGKNVNRLKALFEGSGMCTGRLQNSSNRIKPARHLQSGRLLIDKDEWNNEPVQI